MTLKIYKYSILIIVFTFLTLSICFSFLDNRKYQKEILLTEERELKVNIDAAFGELYISRDGKDQIVRIEIHRDSKYEDPSSQIEYKIRDKIGYLVIPSKTTKKTKGTVNFKGIDSEKWILDFSKKIPISFDIELGAGKGKFDFSGLLVKDLNISTGASSVSIYFDKMNEYTIENMNIESGVSKFKAYNLSNANFNYFKFSGGLGSYDLDFGGELNKEVDVNIEIGLGSLTILIPKNIGAKIWYEKNWISNIDLDKDFIEENSDEYVTSNYYNTKGKMNIRIEAGIGTVKVKRIK